MLVGLANLSVEATALSSEISYANRDRAWFLPRETTRRGSDNAAAAALSSPPGSASTKNDHKQQQQKSMKRRRVKADARAKAKLASTDDAAASR